MNNKSPNKFLSPVNTPKKKCLKMREDLTSISNYKIDNYQTPTKKGESDRFIPKRSTPLSQEIFNLSTEELQSNQDLSVFSEKEQDKLIYSNILEQKILNFDDYDRFYSEKKNLNKSAKSNFKKRSKLLKFNGKKENNRINYSFHNAILETNILKLIKYSRRIPKTPYKILDAPGIADDFYTHILDWSKTNILAISLTNSVYLWKKNKKDAKVIRLCELEKNFYTTIKFSKNGDNLLCGDNHGSLDLYDVNLQKKIFNINNHKNRICSISFKNENIFSTGSRDKTIKTFDKRTKKLISEHKKHKEEVCGLEWSPKEPYLASGGNENHVYIWDIRKKNPVQFYNEHTAAVRALAWSNHHFGTLITGGGNSDKSIKFWNVNSIKSTHTINTNSQVCSLIYSTHFNEFISTHGFSKNQIMIWKGDTKKRITVIDGHHRRVLHTALSPDGESLATAASDETLKFWTVFPQDKKEKKIKNSFDKYLIELR